MPIVCTYGSLICDIVSQKVLSSLANVSKGSESLANAEVCKQLQD